MIKCIFFDVGGVYMKGDFRDFLKKAKDLLNVSKTNGVANHRVFDADYNKGRISIEECFSKFFGIGTDDSNMGRLVGYWSNTWKPEKR